MLAGGQLRQQQMLAAENIQRQIAIAVIVAMKEPRFLMAMQEHVRRVQIQHNLRRRFVMGLHKQGHPQPFNRPVTRLV